MTTGEDSAEVQARLFKAIEAGELGEIREVLEVDSRLASARNAEGARALIWATYYRQPGIAELLMAYGAKPDVFEAAALDLNDRVKDFLQADRTLVDRYSFDGWTPLHLAAHFGSLASMRALLANGASPRAVSRNSNGNQPLQAAAAGRQADAVEMLLKVGAEVDARSEGGFTALHIAAANGDQRIAKALLEAGATVDVKTEGGKAPVDLAIEANHEAIVDLLEAAGGSARGDAS